MLDVVPQPDCAPDRTPQAPACVRLLDVDPDWQDGLDPRIASGVARLLTLPVVDVPRGMRCSIPEGPAVVLQGFLLRTTELAGRRTVQVLGPGDVIAPDGDGGAPVLDIIHEAVVPARLAVLDATFARAAQRWPSLAAVLVRRLLAQERRAFAHLAIAAMPRVEERLLAMLWHLTERFGRMTGAGAVLELRLSHQVLGQLIGSARPTVSLACKELELRGAARRSADRHWTLAPDGLELLDGTWPELPPAVEAALRPAPAPAPVSRLAEARPIR